MRASQPALRSSDYVANLRRRFSLDVCDKAAMNGLDELVRCPWPDIRTVPPRVAAGWRRCFDLLECEALFDQVPNAIANDADHVAIFHNIKLIQYVAMPWNNQSAF